MKLILLCWLTLFLFSNAFSQRFAFNFKDDNKNDREIIRSNKILREEVYKFDVSRRKLTDSFLVKIIYYDTSGRPVQVIVDQGYAEVSRNKKNTEGTITYYSYSYDPGGRLFKEISDNPGLNGVITTAYGYDSAGNIQYKAVYNEDTSSLMIEHRTYDQSHHLINLSIKVNNGEFYDSARYFYDSAGVLSKEVLLDKKGNVLRTRLYEYSPAYDMQEDYIETVSGKKLESRIFYNSDKQRVKESQTLTVNFMPGKPTELKSVFEYSFNKDKTLFQWVVNVEGDKVQLNRHYYFKE